MSPEPTCSFCLVSAMVAKTASDSPSSAPLSLDHCETAACMLRNFCHESKEGAITYDVRIWRGAPIKSYRHEVPR